MIFQEKLCALRARAGLTQEALAEQLGVSRQAVAKWEQGISMPDLGNIVALARAFQVTVDALAKPDDDCGAQLFPLERADADALVGVPSCAPSARRTRGTARRKQCPAVPGSHDLTYREDGYLYIDSYLGGERFVGEEAVWREGIPVWAMNYSGKVLSSLFEGDFLKRVLLRGTPDQPFRGPKAYREGDSLYRCETAGSMDWFTGSEEIYTGDERTYLCVFHGGMIR